MNEPQTLCNISSLLGHRIVTAEGKHVGHVADIVLTQDAPYKVTGFLYGESGWEHRLHLLNPFRRLDHVQTQPDMLSWEHVERIERSTIILKKGY